MQGHDELVLLIGHHVRAADLREDEVRLGKASDAVIVVGPIGSVVDEVCDLVDEIRNVGGGGSDLHAGIVSCSGADCNATL